MKLFRELGEKMAKAGREGTFKTWMLEESDLIQKAARAYGDHLIADTLNDRFRNRVAISGGVQISGYYGVQKGLKLSELIQMAGGYREDGLRGSAVISSMDTLGLRSYQNVPYSLFSTFNINEGDSVLIPLIEYFKRKEFFTISGEVKIHGLKPNSLQADKAILKALVQCGAKVIVNEDFIEVKHFKLNSFSFDATDCPDLFPALAALASCCVGISIITGISRLINKESNNNQLTFLQYI